MHLNNVVKIEIKNIIIENKYYEYDCDDPRYDVNDKIKSINKKYIHVYNNINNLNYELEDFLEEIGKEYCNSLLDTTLDDIIIYCDVTIIDETEKHYNVSYDYYNFDLIWFARSPLPLGGSSSPSFNTKISK